MADLVSPALLGGDDDEEEEGLEEAEIETLKEAGLISRKKGGNPRKSKHIVFVENADQGQCCHFYVLQRMAEV